MVNALIMSLVVVDLIVGNSALHCYCFITSHRLSSFLCVLDDPFGIHSKVGLCVRYGPSQDWLMFGNACPRHRSYVSVLSKIAMQGPGPLFIDNYIMIGDVSWGNCTVCPNPDLIPGGERTSIDSLFEVRTVDALVANLQRCPHISWHANPSVGRYRVKRSKTLRCICVIIALICRQSAMLSHPDGVFKIIGGLCAPYNPCLDYWCSLARKF